MAMTEYPSSLPMDCFKTVAEILRGRELMERKAEAAHCLWNVQGYLQGILLGVGPAHTFGASYGANLEKKRDEAANDANLRELAQELQDLDRDLQSGESFGVSAATQPVDSQFNPAVFLTLVPAILQLLEALGVFKRAGASPTRGVPKTAAQESEEDTDDASQSRSNMTEAQKKAANKKAADAAKAAAAKTAANQR
jgi:hypothetical protein